MWLPRLADTVFVLDHGEMIAEGTPDEVRSNEDVLRAYLGRGTLARRHGRCLTLHAIPRRQHPLRRSARPEGRQLHDRQGRDRFAARRQCLRQVDHDEDDHGRRAADHGIGDLRRRADREVAHRRTRASRHRPGAGSAAAVPAHDGVRESGDGRLSAQARRGFRRQDLDRVYSLFPRVKERLNQIAGTLSGGEQQMVAMGRALMARPRLICMDEPSMGLSPLFVEQVFDIIQEINRQGTTIFMVEQNANMALSIAHRAYVLQTGQVVLSGSAAELRRNPMIREAYLGELQVT